jgi:hypothetical protein
MQYLFRQTKKGSKGKCAQENWLYLLVYFAVLSKITE